MFPIDKEAVAWLRDANRLPSRNPAPAARPLATRGPESRDLKTTTAAPITATSLNFATSAIDGNHSTVAASAKDDTFDKAHVKLLSADSANTRLCSGEAVLSKSQTPEGKAHDSRKILDAPRTFSGCFVKADPVKVQERADAFLNDHSNQGRVASSPMATKSTAITMPWSGSAQTSHRPGAGISYPVSYNAEPSMARRTADAPGAEQAVAMLHQRNGEVVPLTTRALDQVSQAERPVMIKSKKSHSTWEVSEDPPSDVQPKGDIRHIIGPKNKLEHIEGRYVKDPWNNQGDDDGYFFSAEFYNAFVEGWRAKVSGGVRVSHEDLADCTRDVDTDTGLLLRDAFEQPMTIVDVEENNNISRTLREHREHWTASFIISRENRTRQKAARRQKEAAAHVATRELRHRNPTPPNPVVETDCVFRPAKAVDVPSIVEIYNLEIKRGIRAWDTRPATDQDFHRIGRSCFQDDLPFIVAVRRPVDLADPANWPSHGAYEAYMEWRAAEPEGSRGKQKDKIVGFAFAQTYDGGFGRGSHVGRLSARLTFFVHPEHRRKHIGTALLDRLMIHLSRVYPGNRIQHN